ncbi:MAG: hypothetical protein NC078_02635 [Ruminococcus sp.]|nr:hypothetical protein [Ruminococcus sp.]
MHYRGAVLILVLAAVLLLPVINEKAYIRKAMAAEPGKCAGLLYRRIISHIGAKMLRHGESLTPNEARGIVKDKTGYDMGELTKAVEMYSYGGEDPEGSKERFRDVFFGVKSAAEEYRREKNREDRRKMREMRQGSRKG